MLALPQKNSHVCFEELKVNSQEGSEAHLSIACYNSSRSFTLAGSVKQVDYAENLLRSDSNFSGVRAKRLNVTNAFHSALVDALVDNLENLGHTIEFRQPKLIVGIFE